MNAATYNYTPKHSLKHIIHTKWQQTSRRKSYVKLPFVVRFVTHDAFNTLTLLHTWIKNPLMTERSRNITIHLENRMNHVHRDTANLHTSQMHNLATQTRGGRNYSPTILHCILQYYNITLYNNKNRNPRGAASEHHRTILVIDCIEESPLSVAS